MVTGQGKDVLWEDGYWLGKAAIWKKVAKDPILMEQFSEINQNELLKGNAPFVLPKHKWGGGGTKRLNRYVLHHKEQIQYGGAVHDIDNLDIVTPRLHWGEIHRKRGN